MPFVTLEGGEGSGKSVQALHLKARLEGRGLSVVATREPGGTPVGEGVRGIVLHPPGGAPIDPLAELLLFEAARAQLVATVIRPALQQGAAVVCDRFADSSLAYQGYGRGLDLDLIERLNATATGGLRPDLTLLLDVPVHIGLARRRREGGLNSLDGENVAFHERVRQGYLALARKEPARWRVIDGSRTVDEVADAVWSAVREWLG
jgi:dTMP kinase